MEKLEKANGKLLIVAISMIILNLVIFTYDSLYGNPGKPEFTVECEINGIRYKSDCFTPLESK